MGIIKAAINAVGGALADSWGEVIKSSPMDNQTCFVPGRLVSQNGKSQNKKGSENIVSNGSVIFVQEGEFMILTDGGKIVDFTAEAGYFQVSNSSMPSLFTGQFGDSIKEAFNRVKFGGIPSQEQHVFFINVQEIKDLPFGTPNPINYFDNFYNAELNLRAHGFYSVRVVDPFKFYEQVIPSSAKTGNESVSFSEIARQYTGEFTSALGATINKYSADGNRISYIKSKQYELGEIMSTFLDEKWTQLRGLEVVSVNVDASYDQDSQELINMRNKGAMLSDQAIQQGYVAGNISEGLKDAGSNANGSMAGFMGMGIGMNAGGNILGGYMQNPQYNNQQPNQQMNQQMNPQPQAQPQQQTAPVQGGWTCECGATNTGNFCSECGSKKPNAPKKKFCTNCGTELSVDAKFCPECGTKA